MGEGVNPELNACMTEKVTAQRAAGAQPPIPPSEVQNLIKFADFTDSPPGPGTFLRSGTFMRNMPPDVKQAI